MTSHNRGRAASYSTVTGNRPGDLHEFHLAPVGVGTSPGTYPSALNGHSPLPLSSPSLDGDGDGDVDEEEEEEDEDEADADFQSHYSPDAPFSSGSSESSESPHGDEPGGDSKPPHFLQHHHRHHSNSSLLIANSFAPPFYNRPPTPLPPSPSLTSLLRPSFSTTTSRPTTPDSSENDTPNDTEAAVAKSARTATTVPRASPKVPTYEYYGFVLYLLSSLAFLMYLLWSYLPSPFLHQLGINYYPDRWWALAIPSFLVMTIVYIYVALASYNTGYLTLPMSSIENIVDEATDVAVIDRWGKIRARGTRDRASSFDYYGGVGGGGGGGRGGSGGGVGNGGDSDGLQAEDSTREKETQTQREIEWEWEWKTLWNEGTDGVMDVPLGGVCQVLYSVP